jgi:hypothetical protein
MDGRQGSYNLAHHVESPVADASVYCIVTKFVQDLVDDNVIKLSHFTPNTLLDRREDLVVLSVCRHRWGTVPAYLRVRNREVNQSPNAKEKPCERTLVEW